MHIVIGKPATESAVQHYECPRGHKIISAAPITIGWYGDVTKAGGLGGPICPHCIVEFVRTQFPMTQVKAPEKLKPAVLPEPGSGPTILARPCSVEECILAQHPGSQHMNAGKTLFETEPANAAG